MKWLACLLVGLVATGCDVLSENNSKNYTADDGSSIELTDTDGNVTNVTAEVAVRLDAEGRIAPMNILLPEEADLLEGIDDE